MEQLKCTEPGCNELAVYTYAWPWGEQGACCGTHAPLVAQKATNLGREAPQLVAVPATGAPVVLSRDERVGFRAQILTLEEEVVDAKKYAGELYTANGNLNAEVMRLTSRTLNLERSVTALGDERDAAVEERDAAREAAADAAREAANLKLLVHAQPQQPQE